MSIKSPLSPCLNANVALFLSRTAKNENAQNVRQLFGNIILV
jgi:hypothetical protein